MLMSVFEKAWEIAKMARHKVGPVEIWDYNEPNYSGDREKDHEIMAELGVPPMRDRGPEPEWRKKHKIRSSWDDQIRYPINYVPMGGSPWFGNMAAKVLMTPTQYLSLNVPTKLKYADRDRPDKILESPLDFFIRDEDFSGVGGMAQSIKEGYPIFIPNINIRRPDASDERNIDFRVTGHEGRHRMAAIHDLLGDVPVPVQISSDEFGGQNELGQRTIGGSARPSSKMQEALLGAVLGGRENPDARFTIRELFDEMYD